ncbi:DUF2111 domain-containing protein [Methanotorris formicicus]|uniref:Uncharacterized conserved protein UCP006557, signal transduction n=1 Tax=Methanotorris formicicus Mc-S-70 TaxID=647171 RepID=H1KWZ5_9EURY|nr:DUF2111 domain-containing protein [Methanotorris formicicus]EHP88821.1 Uncharacterized conserved protein UCP006557, signal transduction [Methanotorris formicicus Mc-S-70]
MLKELLKNADPKDLLPFAMAIHILVNKLPVTVRSKEKPGIRLEKGDVIDDNYEGYVLKLAIETGEILRVTPVVGPYKGLPVIIVPIKDGDEVLGAIGAVDVTAGIFEDVLLLARRAELSKFLPEDAFPK